MRKLLKFSAWAAALALAIGLTAFLTLKFYFTPDRIRKLVMEYAGKNIGREISLDAAALNLRFVPRGQYAQTALAEGDKIEIIAPVTGG